MLKKAFTALSDYLFANQTMSRKMRDEVTNTQIVCGHCAGNNPIIQKTLLTVHGLCQNCGGRSYILASELAARRRAAMIVAQMERERTEQRRKFKVFSGQNTKE